MGIDICRGTNSAKKEGILLTIDFEKAFDSLSEEFMFKPLEAFNVSPNIIDTINICYKDTSSCVLNYQTTTRYFDISRGVRQGDPLSPYLFISALELLSIYVQNDKSIHEVHYNQSEIKLLLYADDIIAILQPQADAAWLLCINKRIW